jgi:hypothetical protein
LNSPVAIGLLLVASLLAGGFLGLLPSITSIRGAGPGSEVAHDLHTGLTVGEVILVALGLIATYAEKSPMPLIGAGIVTAVVVAAYEWILRTDGLVL